MKPKVYINAPPAPIAEAFSNFSAMVSISYVNTGVDAAFLYDEPKFSNESAVPEDEQTAQINSKSNDGSHSPSIARWPHDLDQNDDFNEIIVRYNESLHAFVFHILHDMAATEDVVQDTFLALWVNRDKMDFNLPLRNFLYVTARNFAYRHLRRQKRFDNDLPPVLSEEQISVYIIQEEAIRILKESIQQLPQRTAEVIRLSLEGMSQEQIAEQMGVGVANVKRLKALGIAKLKEIMGPIFSIAVWLLY